jgi:putative membrane protein
MPCVFARVSMLVLLAATPGLAVAQTDKPQDQNSTGSSAVPDMKGGQKPDSGSQGNRGEGQQANDQDRKFLEQAGSAGLAEVQAGNLALHRAAGQAVREFGRWMITDHTAMGDMLTHHAEQAGLNAPSGMSEKDSAALNALQQFQGAEFDVHYIAAQVEAHKQAMELFKQEAQSGENPDLKSFAQRAEPMLTQHLAQAEELAKAPESSTARSSAVTTPPAAPMTDPKTANPALQSADPAKRKSMNQEGARKIETEGK